MSELNAYLERKRAAIERRRASGVDTPPIARAAVRVSGGSGIRQIRSGAHQVLVDSPADFAGHDLGPSALELLAGAVGACVAHSVLIQAAAGRIALDAVRVDVEVAPRELPVREAADSRSAIPGAFDIRYDLHIDSPANETAITELHELVARVCPILGLLQTPARIQGRLQRGSAAG